MFADIFLDIFSADHTPFGRRSLDSREIWSMNAFVFLPLEDMMSSYPDGANEAGNSVEQRPSKRLWYRRGWDMLASELTLKSEKSSKMIDILSL